MSDPTDPIADEMAGLLDELERKFHPTCKQLVRWRAALVAAQAERDALRAQVAILTERNRELEEAARLGEGELDSIYAHCKQTNCFEVTIGMYQRLEAIRAALSPKPETETP